MIDRDGRIVFGSLLAFVFVLTGSVVAERQLGVGLREYPVLAFVVFSGVAIVAPQLYLAATDDEVPPRARIQFAAVGTAVLAVAFAGEATGIRYLLIAGAGACSVLGLVWYELVTWYRSSSEGTAPGV
ncbi:hypothetical protein [Haloterrigena alkaliphila]|uniref:Uncharacterized protein n=1 Tax=Haloterrigena alkaliphila TaxID=2816475 RepID=A0A8A2VAN1_9EURY|nr:hypothetical protein [Haloterrigena alkaliphila]QSW97767.1 hypothetical protein J0X25_10070 [Haloterrigena alkaliphila]